MRDATNPTRQSPNRFPDSGAYPEERAPRAKSTRAIDCSAAEAARRARAERDALEQAGTGIGDDPALSSER